jgi:allophanate hydrolase subunit 2
MLKDNLINLSKGGIYLNVGLRQFGTMDYGISPVGANDQLSFKIAHILLGEPTEFQCLEIILSPKIITFKEEIIFSITGACYPDIYLNDLKLKHATVYSASPNDKLTLSGLRHGIRTYLMATSLNQGTKSRIGLTRESFNELFQPYTNILDLTIGPEHSYLNNDIDFLSERWELSINSNQMGVRLVGKELQLDKYDIISGPVVDGTIQGTPSGPIILLRHRQTTGGYPRLFQVCEVSINHLSQLNFKNIIKFRKISREEAINQLKQHEYTIEKFKQRYI